MVLEGAIQSSKGERNQALPSYYTYELQQQEAWLDNTKGAGAAHIPLW